MLAARRKHKFVGKEIRNGNRWLHCPKLKYFPKQEVLERKRVHFQEKYNFIQPDDHFFLRCFFFCLCSTAWTVVRKRRVRRRKKWNHLFQCILFKHTLLCPSTDKSKRRGRILLIIATYVDDHWSTWAGPKRGRFGAAVPMSCPSEAIFSTACFQKLPILRHLGQFHIWSLCHGASWQAGGPDVLAKQDISSVNIQIFLFNPPHWSGVRKIAWMSTLFSSVSCSILHNTRSFPIQSRPTYSLRCNIRLRHKAQRSSVTFVISAHIFDAAFHNREVLEVL